MSLWSRISNYWLNGLSIKVRLGLGIALLLVLNVTIAATIMVGRYMLNHAEEVMSDSMEIQRLVLQMNQGMEEARRLHGYFFLHAGDIGFGPAHERYAQPSARKIAQVLTLSNGLKELVGSSVVGEGIRKNKVDVNLYLSFAKRFAATSIEAVELFTGLNAPGRGLYPQLHRIVEELGGELAAGFQRGSDPRRLFVEMKYHIQEYRITHQRPLMQSAFNGADLLRKSLADAPVAEEGRVQRIRHLLDRARELAEKILVAELAIKSRFSDFALQSAAVDKVSLTLERLTREEVRRSQQKSIDIRKVIITVVLLITLLGLLLTVFVVWMLNQFVIRRVTGLTRYAGELREGNLDVVVPEDSADELGQLARTFNLMSARIKESVKNLELQVEQRTAELSISEKRFRQLFENSSSGVIVYEACDNGSDFLIKDCNKAVEEIELMERRDLIGRRATEVFPGIREFGLLAIMRGVWESGEFARKPVSFYADDRLSGWRENAVYKLPSGEIVCIYTDCTLQKKAEAEKQAMEEKLHRAQKMEAIGLMAGGVAHDLNNILSGIVGFPDVLLMNLSADSELRKPVQIIKESGQRAAAVVSDLLTVARGVVNNKETVSLNSLVDEYMASPEHQKIASMHPQIECASVLEPNLPPILCSSIHIKKCIMNLVTNAMESIDVDGRVIISTRGETIGEEMARQHGTSPGKYVVLAVSDSGKGISDKDLEHIFEPFYSKKVMGISGTGLGLAVVWNSVVDHAGTIQVESSPEGTTFSLSFPASSQVLAEKDVEKSAPGGAFEGRGEKVLVVDDEAMLRDLAASMLNQLGYAVECVSSGEQAVDYLREHHVDLVLLDMIMDPGINGLETYKRILSFLPGQKTVIVSGFSESEALRTAHSLGAEGFVKKPYSFEQLGRMVRQELDR